MEVGAVKQAFNNEVILLKKKLDQAKIQIINKLTRKAKTLTQKKAPEHLAEKVKRKATAAVNDVMAIKKIHNKDIARFAITHTGNLNDFLNKPTSSPVERACARLLLHKALQDKYKLLRSRFADVPIKDLFMSRQERLKIKKEEKEKQKLKKKEKEDRRKKRENEKKTEKTPVQAEGDWSVEDIDIDELILNKKFVPKRKAEDDGNDDSEIQSDDESIITESKQGDISTNDLDSDGDSNNESEVEKFESENEGALNMNGDDTDNEDELNNRGDDDDTDGEQGNNQPSDEDDDNLDRNLSDAESVASSEVDNESKDTKETRVIKETNSIIEKRKQEKPTNVKPVKVDNRKKLPKQNKDKTKTKILFSEKRQSKKTKTHSDDLETPQGNRIVDPFFITATGENYMSIVEPRAPDEVKEVHKQGNRQMRRAALFGHVPKAKPRFNNNFSNNKNRDHGNFSNNNGNSRFGGKNDKFNRQNGLRNRDSSHNKFENSDGYQKRDFTTKNVNSFNSKVGDNQDKSHNFKRKFEAPDNFGKKPSEPEKLHPSWEAKKKMSSVQPFQGKKTVFE